MSVGSQTAAEERLSLDLSRRKHFRLECRFKAAFAGPSGTEHGEIVVRNLGIGGARIDSPCEFPMPSKIVVTLPGRDDLDTPQAEIRLDCHVVWTVADRAEGPFPTGIRFSDVDGELKHRLFCYLASVMR